jgi:DnaJ family protein A protein 2
MSLFADLGLEPTCTLEDVKKAYKKLAMIHHPDKGGDSATFHKIQTAYETLSDPQKRSHYEARNGPGGLGNNFFDLNVLFSRMNINFNQARRKLPDEHLNVEVKLDSALTEKYQTYLRKLTKLCASCMEPCTVCKGQGRVMTPMRNGMMITTSQMVCSGCNGIGLVYAGGKSGGCKCLSGTYTETVNLVLPVEHPVIFFEKLGKQPTMFLEDVGNLYIHMIIKPDNDTISLDKSDIVYRPALALKDMMLGCEITLPAELQHQETIVIKPMTLDPAFSYVIPNKGLFTATVRGNLRICPSVDYAIDMQQISLEALEQVFYLNCKN